MDFNSEIVGKRLRELRESRGITQKQMAAARKMTQSAIAKQESGITAIGDEGLCWYADYFGVSTDYLLGRTDAPAVYSHGTIDVTGETWDVFSNEENLPPEKWGQVERHIQSAMNDDQPIILTGSSREDLESLIRRIAERVYKERDSQNENGQ